MKQLIIFISLWITCVSLYAHVHGVVLDEQGQALVGANVYWAGTGNGTATDAMGMFELEPVGKNHLLVASYIGYRNDTLEVHGHEPITFVLIDNLELDEVVIAERKAAVVRSRLATFDTQTLGSEELCKAACCNLSESFETSASVDVAYADAATGAKQIRLLGLNGTYVQLLGENCPAVRGLAQNFGMEYIPGPWMESIQVSKGTSSVLNGYEAITGQINVEYLKPQTQDPISINAMLNTELHAELNVEGGWEINPYLHTGILAHVQNGSWQMDHNKDGFLDMPLNQNYNLMNRWYYKKDDYTFQFLVRGLYDLRQAGQRTTYPIDLSTWRVDGFMKNGIVFDEETGMSLGLITAASYHNQHNLYGEREWNAAQTNAYLNAIFQNSWEGGEILDGWTDNDHKLSAGLSLNYDKYDESILHVADIHDLSRWEVTPGIFGEYTYKIEDWFSMIAGVRMDWSSRYGLFFTPRLNVRYAPFEWWTLRASAGMGYRSPNVIADNAAYLPSMRGYYFDCDAIEQERSVNAGMSTTFYIPLGSKQLQLTADYYYTTFLNALVADVDMYQNGVVFYNLSERENGQSFSHNAQIEASIEVLRGWTWTAAFRYTDVRQTSYSQAIGDYALRMKPLTNRFKGIITTSYQTPLKKWQFDLTAQFNGGGRMPDSFDAYGLTDNSKQYYRGENGDIYYKWYPQLMGQITKYWRTCSLYVGAENMTDFYQESPVVGEARLENGMIDTKQPFDASMVWGPTSGWKVYVGFRWSIAKPDED